MVYGTELGIKDRCGIDSEDNAQIDVIRRAQAYADGVVDAVFAGDAAATVPTSTPQAVKDAADDLAAYYYLRNKAPERAKSYLDSAFELLTKHIKGTYQVGGIQALKRGGVKSANIETGV